MQFLNRKIMIVITNQKEKVIFGATTILNLKVIVIKTKTYHWINTHIKLEITSGI